MQDTEGPDHGDLLRTLEALSSPTRLRLLGRLAQPGFVTALADELGLSRQAVQKHLRALEEVGLVEARPSWRGAARAVEYLASPAGLFVLKESLHGLVAPTARGGFPLAPTRPASRDAPDGPVGGAGLLLVHGDVPGRWFPLAGRAGWIVGRAPAADVCLSYDPFASARHALLRRVAGDDGGRWEVTDLHSRNGTLVNLRPIPAGGSRRIAPGDLVTVGRSHLLLREGV